MVPAVDSIRNFYYNYYHFFIPRETMAKHIAIIGGGETGRDIARCASMAGLQVLLYDVNDTILRRTIEIIKEDLQKVVKQGLITSDEVKAAVGRIKPKTELKALGTSEIVIETSHNDIRVKKDLFKKLESTCRLNTILAAHTSTISVNAIASACTLRQKIVGMHFLAPAHSNPIVEIVRGGETSEATLNAVADLAFAMQKKPILVRESPGLIADRMNRIFFHEALHMAQEHIADPGEIDRIVKLGGGFLEGPFNAMDHAGLDTELGISEAIFAESCQNPRYRPQPLLRHLVSLGYYGVRSERGFFPHIRKFKV